MSGSVSSGEFSSSATTVSATMDTDVTRVGNDQRTAVLILETSEVMRVTRSPLDAASTWPSGSRSTARTTYSRAEASRS
jgi:hypothetical protein